jgi:hypothetical protein
MAKYKALEDVEVGEKRANAGEEIELTDEEAAGLGDKVAKIEAGEAGGERGEKGAGEDGGGAE